MFGKLLMDRCVTMRTWLTFFMYLIAACGSLEVFVCPVVKSTKEMLHQFRDKLLCNRPINCNVVRAIFRNAYDNNVIIVHDGLTVQLESALSSSMDSFSTCEAKFVFVNVKDETGKENLTNVCSSTRLNVVIAFVNDSMLNFIRISDNLKQCGVGEVDIDEPYNVMTKVVTTCLNTVWVVGNRDCWETPEHFVTRVHNVFGGNEPFALSAGRQIKIATIALTQLNDIVGCMILMYPFTTTQLHIIYNRNRKKLCATMYSLNQESFYEVDACLFEDDIVVINQTKNGIPKFGGSVFIMIDRLAQLLNFTYEVYESADGKFGILEENGNWSGLVGMLARQEVDIAAAGLTITSSRGTVVDFTAPYYYEPYGILIRKPQPENKLWNAFSVFSLNVWIGVFVSAIVAIFFVYFIHNVSPATDSSGLDKLESATWYIWSGLVNQGCELESMLWSGRNFLAFWWLYIVAIIAVYSGLLVANLSTGKLVLPVKDLAELAVAVKEGRFEMCTASSTNLHEAIKEGKSTEYNMLKEAIEVHPNFVQNSDDDCFAYLLHAENVAVIAELSTLQVFQMNQCNQTSMIILEETFQGGYLAIALQKNSPLNAIFSLEITEAVDAGLVLMWKDKYSPKRPFCEIPEAVNSVETEHDSLGLDDLVGCFVILAMGIAVSVFAFVFEHFHHMPKRITRHKSEVEQTFLL